MRLQFSRQETQCEKSITVAIVLRRNEKGVVGAHNSKDLTLSWGTGLMEAFYKLQPDRGGGNELGQWFSDPNIH